MALFKSAEEKQAQKDEKLNQWLEAHGMAGMKPEYAQMIKPLSLIEAGAAMQKLGGGNAAEISKEYLYVIKEQNWMIIRLLNDIANK